VNIIKFRSLAAVGTWRIKGVPDISLCYLHNKVYARVGFTFLELIIPFLILFIILAGGFSKIRFQWNYLLYIYTISKLVSVSGAYLLNVKKNKGKSNTHKSFLLLST